MTAVLSAPQASISDATLRQANRACMNTIRITTALPPAICELADILRPIKAELGDDFPEWVTTQLPITIDNAEFILRFVDEHVPADERFAQATAVPFGSHLSRLEIFCEHLPLERAVPSDTAPEPSPSMTVAIGAERSLTETEKQQLLRHSLSLYLQVKKGEVTIADALQQMKTADQPTTQTTEPS